VTIERQSRADALQAAVRGEVLHQEHPDYERARQVYNALIQKRPSLIVRPKDAGDVMAAVNFGRNEGLEIAIRGGGHHGGGFATVDDGLVIDLSALRGVRVNPVARTAQVAAGAVLSEVDHATHAFGLAAPFGIFGTTGASGLTLGGGVGHLSRKLGLSIDNLIEVDVVLADGSFVTANETSHPDLLWALRGGGGNFGVVTSLTFRLHPVSNVFFGPMLWPLDRANEVLSWYREFILAAPDDLNGFFAFLSVPPGPPFPEELHLKKVCGIVWCSTAGLAETDALLRPARELAPVLDGVAEVPLPVAQGAFDPVFPPGLQWVWRSDFVKEIPDAAVAAHVEWGSRMPTWQSTMHLYPIDGAARRVAPNATAWGYRDANWVQVMAGIDADPGLVGTLRDWTVGYWQALHPFSMGGAYLNMMMEEGQPRAKAAYGGNYERLARIKAKYDPDNIFHINQNIRPAPKL
jgi:FAD/FMN-containing dehydrogenase